MKSEVLRIRRWLSDAALPLWASEGVDTSQGGFVERLTIDARADLTAVKRVRVQARQIYVFAHAAVLELYPEAAAIAAHGYRFLRDHALPQGIAAGFVHALHRDGQVADARRDSYDHAFVLFALSWYVRATGDAEARALLRPLAGTVFGLMGHPGGAGITINDRGTLELHQNPHMHFFEALLAAYDTTHDDWFLDRAGTLFMLFRDRMFDRKANVLREFHDAHWHPVAGVRGAVVEPGHHCEWVWLLKRYADRVGTALCAEAWTLFDFAERHGRPDGSVLLCDQLHVDGSVLKADTRSWPQTEAIKADIALAETRGARPGARTDAIVDAVFARFLDPAPAGGWIDWTDPAGAPLVDVIPASTFYHLFLAFSEYLCAHDTE